MLIGTSTVPGAFTESTIKEVSTHVNRPITLPLSNPTRLHEAQPIDLFKWTEGKCLVATGSPFPPVEFQGQKFDIAECNNAMVFPGIGLGCILSRATLLTDRMLVVAVKALAGLAPIVNESGRDERVKGTVPGLLPDVKQVRESSLRVAMAVVRAAFEEGVVGEAIQGIPSEDGKLKEWVRGQLWEPVYREFVRER